MPPLYFDTAATTFVDSEVLADMLAALRDNDGNASSNHIFGQRAAALVEAARLEIAHELGCDADEVVFTGGATEANNLALRGIARAHRDRGRHIVTSAIEHHAILNCCRDLGREGFETTYVRPNRSGWVEPEAVVDALRPDTLIVSIMHTNNETGVMQPISDIAHVLTDAGILFHVDAAQGAGKFAIDLRDTPIDLLSLSAHKFHGPKGVGCLIVRNRKALRLEPLMAGGQQEYGLRPGTLANHQIVGFGSALKRAAASRSRDVAHVSELRTHFIERLGVELPIKVHGDRTRISPYILSLSIDGVPNDALVNRLSHRIAIGTGSACSSGAIEPSHVLRAMGIEGSGLYGAIRIGLGRDHTQAQVNEASRLIIDATKAILALT